MDDVETLLERFIDDRDQLSDEELDELVEALGDDPHLAARLKDQLVIDELLAQRLAVDRRNFVAQVEQRIRDARLALDLLGPGQPDADDASVHAPGPHDAEDAAALLQMRRLLEAERQAQQLRARGMRHPRWLWAAACAVLIAAPLAAAWWWNQTQQALAVVEHVVGRPSVTSPAGPQPAQVGQEIRGGQQLVTLLEESLWLKLRDGTKLRLGSDTAATLLAPTSTQGRRVEVHWGELDADVRPQPAGRPLVLATPVATATVRGTRFWLSTSREQTRVDVFEGVVELARKSGGQRVAVQAQEYGIATASRLAVKPLAWPVQRRDAVFLLQTADSPALIRPRLPGEFESVPLEPRGAARLDHNYALVLAGGAYVAPASAGDALLNALVESSQLTLEATISPDHHFQSGPARIVTFSTDSESFNFMLGQSENRLIFRLNTAVAGRPQPHRDVELCRLAAGQPQHVAIAYRPGELACYLNGRKVLHDGQLQGDFSQWTRQTLLLGDDTAADRDWEGTLEGVAIYDRFLKEDELRRNAELYLREAAQRPKVPQVEVIATLLARSKVPAIEEIQPARSALVMCKYRVEQVLRGELSGGEALVAQWALLDSRPQPPAALAIGARRQMVLERFGLNPQLEEHFCSDDFREGDDPQKPRYYEINRP